MRGAGKTDQDSAEPVGRDPNGDATRGADHVLEAVGLGGLGLAQHPEGAEHDTSPQQTADQRDERCTPDPSAEAVQAEQPGDAEHGDETEEKRGRRDSAEIETEVDGAEKAAEEVVED